MWNPLKAIEDTTQYIGGMAGAGAKAIASPIGNIGGAVVRGLADGITGKPGDVEARRRLQALLGNAAWAMHPNSFGGRLGKASAAQAEDDIDVIQARREQMRREQVAAAQDQKQWDRGAPQRGLSNAESQLRIYAAKRKADTEKTGMRDAQLASDYLTAPDTLGGDAYQVPFTSEDKNQMFRNRMSPIGALDFMSYQQQQQADAAKAIEMSRPQVSKIISDDQGNATLVDKFGNTIKTLPGVGKRTPVRGMPGAGVEKYKPRKLYKDGDQIDVYSPDEERQAKSEGFTPVKHGKDDKSVPVSEAVKEVEKAWVESYISPDGESVIPTMGERLKKRRELVTQEKAFNNGWAQKFDKAGNQVYLTPEGDVINYLGKKIGQISQAEMMGIPNTLKKSR